MQIHREPIYLVLFPDIIRRIARGRSSRPQSGGPPWPSKQKDSRAKICNFTPFRCILHTTKDKFIHCLCVIFLHTSHSSNSIRYQTATTHAITCTMNITLLSMHNHLKLWKIHKMRQRNCYYVQVFFRNFFGGGCVSQWCVHNRHLKTHLQSGGRLGACLRGGVIASLDQMTSWKACPRFEILTNIYVKLWQPH